MKKEEESVGIIKLVGILFLSVSVVGFLFIKIFA
jgi:hypothetical protein|tara:strand:- start:2344 stop:2445 length:102 start_codon:yes stop_codon:yes gene_type:complete